MGTAYGEEDCSTCRRTAGNCHTIALPHDSTYTRPRRTRARNKTRYSIDRNLYEYTTTTGQNGEKRKEEEDNEFFINMPALGFLFPRMTSANPQPATAKSDGNGQDRNRPDSHCAMPSPPLPSPLSLARDARTLPYRTSRLLSVYVSERHPEVSGPKKKKKKKKKQASDIIHSNAKPEL